MLLSVFLVKLLRSKCEKPLLAKWSRAWVKCCQLWKCRSIKNDSFYPSGQGVVNNCIMKSNHVGQSKITHQRNCLVSHLVVVHSHVQVCKKTSSFLVILFMTFFLKKETLIFSALCWCSMKVAAFIRLHDPHYMLDEDCIVFR